MFLLKLCFCVYVAFLIINVISVNLVTGLRYYSTKDLEDLREEVRSMFQHAYDSYLKYAYPYDELRPISCDGIDTWGSYSLTLIDALDTLAVMGNYSEFQRVADIVANNANFDANINVSVFETNIRIIGGLLSAHLLSYRAGVNVEPGWPCNGPLLRLAEDVARRLLAAFDTATGMPYGTVNLRYGVPPGETTITCTAGVGTYIVEFGTLSRLTGDPLYEEVALKALNALHHHRSSIGLLGNHIDVQSGRWTALDAGIGAGVDSYYEYLAKGAMLLHRPELAATFAESRKAIFRYLRQNDWHFWVSMTRGEVALPIFQSLEAFWPGTLSLVGDIDRAMKSLHNYHSVWKQYGFTPEFYNIPQGEPGTNREGYPLRPELVESTMYLYRVTKDPYLLEVGADILSSIQHSARTPCGYATVSF
ncbi:ER degradation-enhancing alpha-mannosidase-like protein 2 [Ischnura elegans]|uniref:ER degradation-enhancing alpha-mannosidase-like protein 2 n=1 Tax=Ischnura elegans TaxID=197161 RepID=UPI001ED8BA2B|nr:ER degradation-enhancing alpha-mannosidase-like protein 2 [Ischnura elegans]